MHATANAIMLQKGKSGATLDDRKTTAVTALASAAAGNNNSMSGPMRRRTA